MWRAKEEQVAGRLVEVRGRMVRPRCILPTTSEVESIVISALARAQRRHGMSVFFAVYLPDRYHLLLVPRSTSALRRFLRTLNSELGRDLGDHLGWKPRQWPVRYWVAVCGEGEAAQVAKLKQLSELALTDSVFFTPLECQRNT